jgi:TPR repeat protein
VEDLPYVIDYEDAVRRGDATTQNALFKKMTPAAQAQAAQHDGNFPLTIKLLTPLADAGDVNAQLKLAGIYTVATTGYSAKYLPVPDAKVREIFKKAGLHLPLVDPPENLPLAFKYFQSAALKGNIFGEWSLGRAYACGFGTDKNLVSAYVWFSLGLAQRGVTMEMTGASLPIKGHQKDYAVDRDFIIARMKPEEIEFAKSLTEECKKSDYRKCGGE